MLQELSVNDLGVIADLRLVLEPGMTAITGETGAGKTLIVEAIELLVGGRADPTVVRAGAEEARVEARFWFEGEELVLSRVVPRSGRSRSYLNGRLATAGDLTERGRELVDLHGQHAHQSLLTGGSQRAALDRFADVDLRPLVDARQARRDNEAALAALGGDERARARELDLLRFQLAEIEAAELADPDEEGTLSAEAAILADARALVDAAARAADTLDADGAVIDGLASAAAALGAREPFTVIDGRLRALAAEAADVAQDLRRAAERIVDDPARLDAIGQRRRLIADLRRKYGEKLSDVMAFAADCGARLRDLEDHEHRARQLEDQRQALLAAEAGAAAAVGARRRGAASGLGADVERHLQQLAMPDARLQVTVGEADPSDDVEFLLAANPGEPPLPLAKVASGGELARAMLALRLVLTAGPETLVFDEVDAGVGGEAALAVGRALAAVASSHQVLVVTHLPQVAAFADHQVAIRKATVEGRTVAAAEGLDDSSRLVELSRMLSGQPRSARARDHAEELLATAARERSR